MKLLSILFSLYLVGLSLLPCEDGSITAADTLAKIEAPANHHAGLADSCTPFCQCHCCHVHVLKFENDLISFSSKEISTLIQGITQNSGIEIPLSHFQPPQV